MLAALAQASIYIRIRAERAPGLEAQRLEALADAIDAERRTQGEVVPRRRVVGTFAEV